MQASLFPQNYTEPLWPQTTPTALTYSDKQLPASFKRSLIASAFDATLAVDSIT
jgi:hypothetical protein